MPTTISSSTPPSDDLCITPSTFYTSFNHDPQAVDKLETFLWHGAFEETFQKEFVRYGRLVTDPLLQARVLLKIAKNLDFKDVRTWKRTRTQFHLCHEAGWGCSDTLLSQKDLKEAYDAVWRSWGEGTPEAWRGLALLQEKASPAYFEDQQHAFSLFLKLLPSPSGVTSYITRILSMFQLPLLHAWRGGLTEHTLPLFPEPVFRDTLLTGLSYGLPGYAALMPELAGKMLFEEALAWTETLSASFFEELLQAFLDTECFFLGETSSLVLSQEYKDMGSRVVRSALRLHTAFLLTHDLPPPGAQASSRKRL